MDKKLCICGKDHTDSKSAEEIEKELFDQLVNDLATKIDKQILELIIKEAKGKENNENIY
jgi:hypothetical protein